jgi:hypothetical protein
MSTKFDAASLAGTRVRLAQFAGAPCLWVEHSDPAVTTIWHPQADDYLAAMDFARQRELTDAWAPV